MVWKIYCNTPKIEQAITRFPFSVGRVNCHMNIANATLSREHFVIDKHQNDVFLINQSMTNPIIVNDKVVSGGLRLIPGVAYRVVAGDVLFAISQTNADIPLTQPAKITYSFSTYGRVYGPVDENGLIEMHDRGVLLDDSMIWRTDLPESKYRVKDVVTFFETEPAPPPVAAPGVAVVPSEIENHKRFVTAEEVAAIPGVSFMCPYCRAVSELEEVLSVSTSPGLLGDDVLGEHEQQRFLPSRFTGNGLAIDSEGGICTAIACPRCHMTLPQALLETPQLVVSVIGAAGAGKSVFLASSVWRCRQILSKRFSVGFMDMDPVANRWINAYEEKLFFQEDANALQQIEKTEIHSTDVCQSVFLNGETKLLPLPSFFSVKPKDTQANCLVIYDSAGEHFRAGADTSSSFVTLNMLTSDLLFFMFDPSADPRFAEYLEREEGSAKNYAQRQDILLSELAARIRRYAGNLGGAKLSRPLIIGISKSDMLRKHLPMDCEPYDRLPNGKFAFNFNKMRTISQDAEDFLNQVVPEVVATARDIATDVWFVPLSALGHNPKKEGIRPRDIVPHLIELPFVFALASKGLIETVGERWI